MTSESTGSTPRLWAGGPSMIIFIHRICIALSGLGSLNIVAMAISDKAAIEVDNCEVMEEKTVTV